jgi:hypothetical protein
MDYWNGMESGMPRIGALPIGGMYVFDTVLEFDASDRSISYPRHWMQAQYRTHLCLG